MKSTNRHLLIIALLASAGLLQVYSGALAQGASSSVQSNGSFFCELKNMIQSPAFTNFVQSKFGPGSRSGQWQQQQQQAFPAADQFSGQYSQTYSNQYDNQYTGRYPASNSNWQTGGGFRSSRSDNGAAYNSNTPTAFRALLPQEARALGRYDISVLIDSSASMSTTDCPSPFFPGRAISRWEWCREQTSYLARATSSLSSNITIVPFSNKFRRFEHARAADIPAIFNNTTPGGSTNLADALKGELQHYVQLKEAGYATHPLMIAVISDGVPNSKGAVKKAIAEATRHMTNPDEIKITFLQVGTDSSGTRFLQELDRDLMNEGASADIVRTRDFNQLVYSGLPAALAMSLSERAY